LRFLFEEEKERKKREKKRKNLLNYLIGKKERKITMGTTSLHLCTFGMEKGKKIAPFFRKKEEKRRFYYRQTPFRPRSVPLFQNPREKGKEKGVNSPIRASERKKTQKGRRKERDGPWMGGGRKIPSFHRGEKKKKKKKEKKKEMPRTGDAAVFFLL